VLVRRRVTTSHLVINRIVCHRQVEIDAFGLEVSVSLIQADFVLEVPQKTLTLGVVLIRHARYGPLVVANAGTRCRVVA
jgi:hypothetical protein